MHQNSSEILTVGSMAFDSLRTPSGKVDHIVGGSANYFSLAASLFAPVRIVAVVGEDFPDDHLKLLQSKEINVDEVERAKGKTFHWVGEYDRNLNEAKTLSTHLNVFEHFNPKLNAASKKSPYLFLGNINPGLQMSVLDQIENPQVVALDTMNFWITGESKELQKVLKRADILSINEGEARLLSEKESIVAAARVIQKMGPSIVIIKRGEYGASLFTPDGVFILPAFPLMQVTDPTGAGDSFAGALMGYLAQSLVDRSILRNNPNEREKILRHAVLAGCVLASFTVEDFGPRKLINLTKAEYAKRLQEMKNLVAIPE